MEGPFPQGTVSAKTMVFVCVILERCSSTPLAQFIRPLLCTNSRQKPEIYILYLRQAKVFQKIPKAELQDICAILWKYSSKTFNLGEFVLASV